MEGWQLAKEKEIAAHLIDKLRSVDTLDLIAFTAGIAHLVADQKMSPAGKERALRALASVRAGGGTDPSAALELIAGRRFRRCGLFFLSDGGFGRVAMRPDCEATVFAVGHGAGSMPPVLAQLAEPFPVGASFNPAAIRISYFDPKPRDNRWEEGAYTPLGWDLVPSPPLPLAGNAVAYARDDAEVAAFRPRPRDPVLAFRPDGPGTVGAFATALPAAYYDSEAGAAVIRRWIRRLLAYDARERYALALDDRGGDHVDCEITLLAPEDEPPAVTRLMARLDVDGGPSVPLPLDPDPQLAGVFRGSLRLPAVDRPSASTLVLSESGPDALDRPQRIPFLIPPRATTTIPTEEAWTFGLDRGLLEKIATVGGGGYDPGPDGVLLHADRSPLRGFELRPALLVAAASCYLAQIGLRRFGR